MKRAKRIGMHHIAGTCVLVFLSGTLARPAAAEYWPFWDHYKAHFLTADGRVVDWDADECTTSEGEAYALFFALVANDRSSFDSVLKWTETNLAGGSLEQNLPAWLWKRAANGQWGIRDPNSASDADLWIAYTLVQAGRIWGEPSYIALGLSLAERIASEEVVSIPGRGDVLLPGRSGFHSQPESFVTNPSYLPLQILTSFSKEFPRGPWHGIAENLPALLSPTVGNGFAMDWVKFEASSGFSASAVGSQQASGSYDAIRVYLWAGMLDPETPGRNQLLQSLAGMQAYLRTHPVPPERVAPNGDAVSPRGPVGFSAAVIPFLSATGDQAALKAQCERLRGEQASANGLLGPGQRYYDQVLALFSEGWRIGLFQFDSQGELCVRWKKV
jgi:endoglucanase